VRLNCK